MKILINGFGFHSRHSFVSSSTKFSAHEWVMNDFHFPLRWVQMDPICFPLLWMMNDDIDSWHFPFTWLNIKPSECTLSIIPWYLLAKNPHGTDTQNDKKYPNLPSRRLSPSPSSCSLSPSLSSQPSLTWGSSLSSLSSAEEEDSGRECADSPAIFTSLLLWHKIFLEFLSHFGYKIRQTCLEQTMDYGNYGFLICKRWRPVDKGTLHHVSPCSAVWIANVLSQLGSLKGKAIGVGPSENLKKKPA